MENRKIFKKTLDKYPRLCYNNYSKRNEVIKMYRPMMSIKELVEEWECATFGEKCGIILHIALNLCLYSLIILLFVKIFF